MSEELQVSAAIGKELTPAVLDFTATVTRSPSEEVGEWIADYVRSRRYRSQLRIFRKAQEATEAAGLPPSAVPLKVLVPLIDGASLEDSVEDGAEDDSMVDCWANLLANAATESDAHVHPSFPGVLRELDSLDARVLDFMFVNAQSLTREPHGRSGSWESHVLEDALGLLPRTAGQPHAIGLARLDNLVRIGVCFHPTTSLGKLPVSRLNEPVIRRDRIALTSYGGEFVKACRPPQRPESAA